jgi:hypothetical protein
VREPLRRGHRVRHGAPGAARPLAPDLYGRVPVAAPAALHQADHTTAFALNSLYLVLERGFTGIQSREAHGYLANTVRAWPRFTPATTTGDVTVFDVAMAATPEEHGDLVVRWGRSVWAAWSHVHAEIAAMTDRQLHGWRPSS